MRFHGLTRQVLGGDEMHGVLATLEMPFREILVTYRQADYCLPLSAGYRLLSDLGVPLSEMLMRGPVLLSGLLVIVLLPLLVERLLDRGVAVNLAWWLAVSPILVYYGRIVRSYMPIVLLGSIAVAAFYVWSKKPSLESGAVYVGSAALATYFHLVAGPFVIAPFMFWAIGKVLRPAALPSIRSTLLLGGSVGLAILAFLVPARESLMQLLQVKRTGGSIASFTWKGVAALQAGTDQRLFVLLFWLVALVGLALVLWRRPRFGWMSVVVLAAHATGLVILSPVGMQQPQIFNRYLLIGFPLVLIWVSAGLEPLLFRWHGVRSWVSMNLLAAALPVAFFFVGPLHDREFAAGSFAHRNEFLRFFQGRTNGLVDQELPAAYQWLEETGDGAIVEYPWQMVWRYSRVFAYYQIDHGREVLVAPGAEELWDDRLRFHNMVAPRPEELLGSRARFLVLHLDLDEEESRYDRRDPSSRRRGDRNRRERRLDRLSRLAKGTAEELEGLWGPPDFEGADALVWDLDRQRAP